MTDVLQTQPVDLMKQASVTARQYMADAVYACDELLGIGVRPPEVIAAFMSACSFDFDLWMRVREWERRRAERPG